ncbi:hypothetical protein INT45_004169 [Circinella minor]|uniref:Major facilitator superfamily (MFS) profile domain-containing protein n=1 Tax=Circinella minor TaxID=1195481 RepID=A0A8H7VK75_9FUNG|nr:hypothetical protein INT45_004169 [Circinella minor]
MNNNSKTVNTNAIEICQQEQQEHKNKNYISSIAPKITRNNQSDQQKQDIILDHNNNYTNNDVDSINVIVSEKKELQRLLYKLDFRIILLISLCYTFSFMDRTNIGNAKVAGLTNMINITEDQYNIALSIFFLGFILFEVPANLMLNKLGPRLWMSIIIILCGIVMIAMSQVKNGVQLILVRFFLGITEAGFMPATYFYISVWYTKAEMTKRIAIILCCSVIASILGGLLAYGCMFLDQARGLHNWQWIFIIDGALTIGTGIIAFIFLPDFPEKDTTFLNERQRILHADHMATVINNTTSQFILEGEKEHTFLPSIVKGMGFSSLNAQLMVAPANNNNMMLAAQYIFFFFENNNYNLAAICAITSAFSADHNKERGLHIFSASLVAVLGYVLLISLKDYGPIPLYIAVTLAASGVLTASICIVSWSTCNFAGRTKRSITTAIIGSCGNIGGVLSGQLYRASDAPQYIHGHTASLILISCTVITSMFLKIILKKENLRRERMTIEEREELFMKKDVKQLGNKHPDFRYLT